MESKEDKNLELEVELLKLRKDCLDIWNRINSLIIRLREESRKETST